MPTILRLALCLFPNVTALDYQGPVEILNFVSPKIAASFRHRGETNSPYLIGITYFSHTLEPITPYGGPRILPDRRYDDVMDDEQFDILFIPGGPGTRPESVPPSLLNFVRSQAGGAKYLLTVCTGSWILAGCGFLDGKRATTNKIMFREIQAATSEKITWVAKARWVVDGNTWTSSGVTAGMDMAIAFLTFLVGNRTKEVRNILELRAREHDDDEFAAIQGLV